MPKPWWWTASGQPSASTNFDNRSFALNEELNFTVYHASLARRLEEAFEQDLKYSKQITYAEWNSRGIGARIYELFAFPVELFAFPVKEYL
jgi:cardiolipin synthase A/B